MTLSFWFGDAFDGEDDEGGPWWRWLVTEPSKKPWQCRRPRLRHSYQDIEPESSDSDGE